MDTLVHDLRYAVRILLKDRTFTLMAVVALALGIGANNTVFTVLNAVLIRGLPFEEADRIMHLTSRAITTGAPRRVSYPDFRDWRAETRSFTDLAAYTNETANVSDPGQPPERVRGTRITTNAFGLVRQLPLFGRDLRPEDGERGAEPVVILGYGVWQNRYGGDPDMLGRVIRVNEVPNTVIGVMPQGMRFPQNADLWLPLAQTAALDLRDQRSFAVFGRLQGTVSRSEAQAELDAIARRLALEYPASNEDLGVAVQTFNDWANGRQVQLTVQVLMGAVAFVLLIACANVANLLLARSAHRAREVAVRLSMGATRWRVIRQLLIENLSLAVVAAIVGYGLSILGVRLIDIAMQDIARPYWMEFRMDAAVLVFLIVICLATTLVFGLAPALHASKTRVAELLKDAGRTGGGARAGRMSAAMVVVEVSLTVVLLMSAGLMMRSFLILYSLELGFVPDRILTMNLALADQKYPTREQRIAFQERLVDRLNAMPDIEAGTVTSAVPLGGGALRTIDVDGRAAPSGAAGVETVSVVTVGARYFDTVGLAITNGRALGHDDGQPGREAVVVNSRLTQLFFAGDQAVGRRIRLRSGEGAWGPWLTIVGVSPTVRQRAIEQPEPDPVVYRPYRLDAPSFMSIMVRGRSDPAGLISSVRAALSALDPNLPVFIVRTIPQLLARARWPFRVFGNMLTIFALIALVLAAVGIYAVMAYSVTQRTHEFGIRLALGAQPGDLMWSVLRQGLLRVGAGLAIGAVGAISAARVLASLLVAAGPFDLVIFAGALLVLLGVSAAACLVAGRRAARLQPTVALRHE